MASFLSSPDSACLLVLLLETTIGTFSNAILMVIILSGFRGKKIMKTGNTIRICLNISNVCFSILVFTSVYTGILSPGNVQVTDPTLTLIVYSMTLFTLSSSSWLTALLSFFYGIKIMDFKARAIVWMKKNINSVIPWMIVGVEVVAFFSSFLSMLINIKLQKPSMNDSKISFNNTLLNIAMERLSTTLIASCIPFLIVVISTVCTVGTLKKHGHNMRKNMGTLSNKQIKSTEKTVIKIKRLLLAYVFYYLCVLLFYLAVASHLNVQFWVMLLLLSSYSFVQSFLLVLGNPKLQEAVKEMLTCAVCSQQTHP